jgi:hypothetical protein
MIRWLADKLQGRQFAFGGPTPEYTHRLFGRFFVDRHQFALSLRWDSSGADVDVLVKVGPVGMMTTLARRELVDDPAEGPSSLKVRMLPDGRELSTWRNWRHVGICVDRYPPAGLFRVEAGPLGVAVMAP